MANYCDNNIRVTADTKEGVKQLKKFIKDLFNGEDPLKMDGLKLSEVRPLSNLFCYKKDVDIYKQYGTKWMTINCVDVDMNEEYDYGLIEINADTAWGPPNIWIERIAEKYKLISLVDKFDEPGVGFMGVVSADEGEYSYNEIGY